MATSRVAAGVAAATPAPTSETAIAVLNAGAPNGPADSTLVRGECPLTGAASVTAMALTVRRGPTSGLTGAVVGTVTLPVTGAQTLCATVPVLDTAYDGTGYVLSVQATGAAGTCGPGLLEAQLLPIKESFGE